MNDRQISSDDERQDQEENIRKSVKIVAKKSQNSETTTPTQFGIFIQCNGPMSCNIYSSNETVNSSTNNNVENVVKNENEVISKSNVSTKKNKDLEINSTFYFEKCSTSFSGSAKSHLNPDENCSTRSRNESKR